MSTEDCVARPAQIPNAVDVGSRGGAVRRSAARLLDGLIKVATKEYRLGYCALCISRCGYVATLEDGVLTRIDPDPNHPTGHALCIKAKAAPELVYAPDRILHPMRRTRPKGETDPGWQRISWDVALDMVVDAMAAAWVRHGPSAVAFGVATPSGTALADSFAWVHRLAHVCRSPNMVFATENCNWHKDYAPTYTFGAGIGMPDYANTECILLWGFNPATSWLAHAASVRQAQRRGARLIVIDPRRSGLATGADLWLRPRPGSDGALALGVANLLISRGHFDREFVIQWTDGPFLFVEEWGRLLNAGDLDCAGDPTHYVAWNETTGVAEFLPEQPPNAGSSARLALTGRHPVRTRLGMVGCRPVFELLAERCREWPPSRVAIATGIPEDRIAAAAALVAENRPVSFFTWTGTAQHQDATQTGRSIATLYALTGCLDAPGGNVWFAKPPVADVGAFDRVSQLERTSTLGYADRPEGPPKRGWITTRDLFQAIIKGRPYQVDCMLSFGSNFVASKPATAHSDEALRGLGFFAMAEMFETPTSRYADVLLPVCSAWEREGLQAGFLISQAAEAHVQLRPTVVPPRGDSRSDTWIVYELAKRLGLAADFFDGSPEAGLAAVLAPVGITPEQLRAAPRGISLNLTTQYRKYERSGFATPSRRLEFRSEPLKSAGADPLPAPRPAAPDPEFPLFLTTAKWPQFCHSQQRTLPSLRKRMPDPLVEIHPDTAQALGVRAGDWLVVESRTGRMRARARLDPHLAPDSVCAQYGWWQYPDGAGDANRLCDGEDFDPVTGSNNLKAVPCRVFALPEAEPFG